MTGFRFIFVAAFSAVSLLSAADAGKKKEQRASKGTRRRTAARAWQTVARPDCCPTTLPALANKAAQAFAKHDWDAARVAYREMIGTEPENPLAWANLGAVEQQAGKAAAAAECFEKSVMYNPELVQSWLALGLIYSKRGDKYRAMSAFSRAIHEDPLNAQGHNYLAIVAKDLGWTDAAEGELQRAIELNPGYGNAHFNLALMYLERKPPALELAKRHYARATALGVEKDEIVERKLKE